MSTFEAPAIGGVSLPHRLAVGVTVEWKDFSRFASRDEAVAALRSRTGTDIAPAECGALLDLTAAAHGAAVHAVPVNRRRRGFRPSPFASEKDIDKDACLRVMQLAAPELPQAVHEYLLGWVIHWHWVR